MEVYTNPDTENVRTMAHDKLYEFLSDAQKESTNTLLLLSGGSSLSLLNGEWSEVLGNYLTVAMLDERFVEDPTAHNFTQFTQTDLYKACLEKGVFVIDTSIHTQNLDEYTQKYDEALKNWVEQNENGLVLATIGIGANGHVAGIMPFPEDPEYFKNKFIETENYVVGYDTRGKDEYKYRVTATYHVIKKVNKAVTFAIGEIKKEPLTKISQNSFSLPELPSQIVNKLESVFLFSDQPL